MLSEIQRAAVWEGWIGAETRANYFADLSDTYQRRQRVLTWVALVASSGATVTLLADWLPSSLAWVRPALAAIAAAVSLWTLVARYPQNATQCADLYARWNRLSSQFQELWEDMYDRRAIDRLRELRDLETEISKSSTALPNDQRRMLRWEDHVIAHRTSSSRPAALAG